MDDLHEYYRWKISEAVDPVLPLPNVWGIVRRPPSATLWLFGPGDLEIKIEPRVYDHAGWPVPLSAQIEYTRLTLGSDDRSPTHYWTVLTDYGAWEASYIEGHATGTLTLNIRLTPYAEEELVLRFSDLPAALVAELGACLTLPPTAWQRRAGRMNKDEVEREVSGVADTIAE
jgi:hypothetical protein